MSERTIEELKSIYNSLNPKSGKHCVYCGLLATDREHVTPISWINSMKDMKEMGFDVKVPDEVIVPSCRECNAIASAKLFNTFTEKKRHIRERLMKKYKRFYDFKIWKDEEIEELSGRLREQVFYFNEIAKIIKKRLNRVSRSSK